MRYKKRYRYVRPRRLRTAQQENQEKTQKAEGELWALARKFLGIIALASLLGRNR